MKLGKRALTSLSCITTIDYRICILAEYKLIVENRFEEALAAYDKTINI